ncbi:hypothetical protein HYU07_02280 [Candidatus Woesearchaeota archaeon]|nr:hypothetical protein [Candidatus Woesearchaeota archaeon]
MTEKTTPIYSGKYEDFNWVGFGSGSGTNLRECAKVIKPKLIFSDKEDAGLLALEELADVEKRFLKKEEGEKSADYNYKILTLLKNCEKENGFTIDLIVLGGYMRLIKEPLLGAFKDKIINVHPADLSILTGDGSKKYRKYIGDDAVYDAINAGEIATKSSVIMVDESEDHGEILAQGSKVDVVNNLKEKFGLREYAKMHQDVQKKVSDWPALTNALKMIAEGRIALGTEKTHFNEWRTVYVDGKATVYEGFRVKLNGG